MQSVNELHNNLVSSLMKLLNILSFYSPIIVCVSIIVFSLFTGTIEKSFVFFVWIFIITFIRILAFKFVSSSNEKQVSEIPSICLTGLSEVFIPKDISYSTYILTFTMTYFIMPMIMISSQKKVNMINYSVLSFFIGYIVLDLLIKNSLSCIKIFSSLIICDLLSGIFLGSVVSGLIMYGSNLKSYLFINEINSNKEVCNMPSKQQFRCNVYRNGELVGTNNM